MYACVPQAVHTLRRKTADDGAWAALSCAPPSRGVLSLPNQ